MKLSIDLQQSIRFFVDTGLPKWKLLDNLQKEGYPRDEAEQAIQENLGQGILTMGKMYGNDDWLVVTSFMPRMAERLRAQRPCE